MSTMSSLHKELLLLIFGHLESVKDLAQCRIVCKSWDRPAETIMFGKRIKVTSEESAFKIYRHLFRNPSNAKLVRHLDFNIKDENLPYLVQQLMDLAITPEIRQLTGIVNAKKFYDILCKTLGDASVEYKYLELIPDHKQDEDFNNQIKWKLRRYCLYTTIPITVPTPQSAVHILSNLDQFPKLKSVLIFGTFGDLLHLHATLLCTSRLNCIGLLIHSPKSSTCQSKAEFLAWATERVKKEPNMREIILQNLVRYDYVEYLMFKYPNIKQVHLWNAVLWSPDGTEDLNVGNLHRLLDALKPITLKDVSLKLPEKTQMKVALKFAKSRSEKITFDIEEIGPISVLKMIINSN